MSKTQKNALPLTGGGPSSGFSFGRFFLLLRWLLSDRPTTAAIDVTHRCNLKCLHCYWWREPHPQEMDDGDLIRWMRHLRAMGLRAAILYGGEPTLRPEICRAAGEIFDATLAFTNGINGFPELPGGQWVLSLDGPEDINDRIRGEGVYARALESVRAAPRRPVVHMTLCRLNEMRIEEFVRDMLYLPIKGIGFSFVTPNQEDVGSSLFIPLRERDRVVRELLRLKRKYGRKVGFTAAMARQLLMDGAFTKWNRYANCPVSRRVRCFRADGLQKRCTYGERADCSRCGCAAVVAYRGAFRPPDLETLKVILGLLIPDYGHSPKG